MRGARGRSEPEARRASVLLILVRCLAAAGQALILLVLTNSTTIAEYGKFSVGLSAGVILNAVLGLGLNTWLLRLDGEGRSYLKGTVAAGANGASMLSGILVFLVVLVSTQSLGSVAFAAALSTVSDGMSLTAQNGLFGEGRPGKATLTLLVVRLVPVVACLLVVFGRADPFISLSIAYGASSVLANVMLGRRVIRRTHLRQALTGGVQYWKVTVWGMAQQLDVPFVGAVIGASAAGGYSAAFRLASPIHIVTSALNSVFVPALSKESDPLQRRAKGRRLLLTGIGYAALIAAVSPLMVVVGPLLLGKQYTQYGWLFAIFFWNSALSVINQLQITRMYADGQAASVAKCSRISTSTGLALMIPSAVFGSVYLVAACTIVIQMLLVTSLQLADRAGLRKDRGED